MNVKKVGVLMLDTRFPRLPGDIGNPDGFEFPVLYHVVAGASPQRIVREQSKQLLEPFILAACSLVKQGAEIITTSCGFLFMFQKELEKAVPVPVYTSSLCMLPILEKKFGRANIGILTIAASSLDAGFRTKTGIHADIPVGSTESGNEFTSAILNNRSNFDIDLCRLDNVSAAVQLQQDHPNLKAILLECTNMVPHASAIQQTTGLPVYSLNSLLSRKAIGSDQSTGTE